MTSQKPEQKPKRLKLSPARKSCDLLRVPFSRLNQDEINASIRFSVALKDGFDIQGAIGEIDVSTPSGEAKYAASSAEWVAARKAQDAGMLTVPACLTLSVVSETCRLCPNQSRICNALDLDPRTRGTTPPAPNQSPRDRFNPNRTTDLGNAERLIELAGVDLRYSESRGWLIWNGKCWEPRESSVVERFKATVVSSIYREAAAAAMRQDATAAKELSGWAKRAEDGRAVAGALVMARTDPRIYLSDDGKLDSDRFALAVQNGVVDLRTGTIRPHRREDLITRLSPATFDPAADCPTWKAFLHRVMGGNQELIGFLQRSVGYALTGDVSEQCFFVLHGNGANGKSVFCDLIMALLGDDLSTETPADSLMLRRNDSGATNDLARLAGLRLVAANETESGQRLAESRVKALVGGDKIAARFLHREFFTFRPQFKIFLRTNHRPSITGTDLGIWRRVRLVPFSVTIPPEEQDKALVEKLKGELSGILRWAVEGAVSWYAARDLGAPPAIIGATEEYRTSSDSIGEFIDECCYRSQNAIVPASALYEAYRTWAEQRGEHPKNLKLFGESLNERGFDKKRRGDTGSWVRLKIGLLSSEQSEQSEQCLAKSSHREKNKVIYRKTVQTVQTVQTDENSPEIVSTKEKDVGSLIELGKVYRDILPPDSILKKPLSGAIEAARRQGDAVTLPGVLLDCEKTIPDHAKSVVLEALSILVCPDLPETSKAPLRKSLKFLAGRRFDKPEILSHELDTVRGDFPNLQ